MRCASLLLLGCGCLARARAQEDDDAGSEVQSPDEIDQGGVDNGHNDIAVDGVWLEKSSKLYVAIQTTDFFSGNANFGEYDAVVVSYDEELNRDQIIQIGSEGEDLVMALTGNDDIQGDIVIVGSTQSESLTQEHMFPDFQVNGTYEPGQDPSSNWFIATLDSSTLEVTGAYVNGTEFESQQATAVAIEAEGSYYVAGWTWGEYFAENAGADNDDDGEGGTTGYDAWVVKIDEFDQLVDLAGSLQFGTAAYDIPTAMVVDGSTVYVVGTISDDSNVLTAAETAAQAPIFVKALDGDNLDKDNLEDAIIWEMDEATLGTLDDNTQVHGAVLSDDGDELYISGHTEGILPDYEPVTETDGAELFVMSIDTSDGSVNWVWQSEGNATAFGRAGVVLAEDGSPIVAGIAFGNQFNLTFEYWEGGSGDFIAAKIDPEFFTDDDTELESAVSKYFVAPAASNLTREEPLAMVKNPDVEDGVYLIGKQDGDFEDEDVEPEADPDADDDNENPENLNNWLVLKIELEELPEAKVEEDEGRDYEYWPIVGVPVFAGGIILFYIAYKWAEYSKAQAAKQATMV